MKNKWLIVAIFMAVIAMTTTATAYPRLLPDPPGHINVNEGDVVTLYVRVLEDNSSIGVNVNVSWYRNGTIVQTNESVGGGDATYSFVAEYGFWEFTSNATDAEGSDQVTWLVTVNDTTPPSVTSNTNNVRVANGTTVTLNATITDADSGVKNATVNVSKINSTLNTVALENQSGFWLASVVADKATSGFENLNIVACDNSSNCNSSVSMTVWVDGEAPGNVTNLTNSTYAQTYINSTWDNPADADLDHVEVYANDTFKQNVSKGTRDYNLTGLVASTQYNISVRPVDGVGNLGNWTNYSATTAPEPTPTTPPPSNPTGGGSTSSGGSGVVPSEPFENIGLMEKHSNPLVADKPVDFNYNKLNSIVKVAVIGKENENDAELGIYELKGAPKSVNVKAPGNVYGYLSININTKRVSGAIITAKVLNSWLASNNLAGADVKVVKWDGKQWNTLETVEKNRDDKFTFFEAKTDSFSPFAIVGVAKPAEAIVAVTSATTPALTATPVVETQAATETPAPVQAEAAFPLGTIALAVVGVIVLSGLFFWRPLLTKLKIL